jgi:hypothetical protein
MDVLYRLSYIGLIPKKGREGTKFSYLNTFLSTSEYYLIRIRESGLISRHLERKTRLELATLSLEG